MTIMTEGSDGSVYSKMADKQKKDQAAKVKPSQRVIVEKHNAKTTTLKMGLKTVEVPDINYVMGLEKEIETLKIQLGTMTADYKTLRDALNSTIREMNSIASEFNNVRHAMAKHND